MPTLSSLVDRVRMELGDMPKSFVYQIVPDGVTNRFTIPYAPVDGPDLVVKKNNVNISNEVEVEEHTGVITFDTVPASSAVIYVSGSHFRYFTTSEIEHYIETAITEHTFRSEDAWGRPVTLQNLPMVEEYPVSLLASTFALYTLATDAAFDIDILAPDGVNIPRSERYRQLMEIIQLRQAHYQELCERLGVGLYRIEVFTLRRISQRTNRYAPIYKPQEVDDHSRATRVRLQVPNYGGENFPSDVPESDLKMYEGDSFLCELDFPFDITGYTLRSQIRDHIGSPVVLQNFTITVVSTSSTLSKVNLSLTSSQTKTLPQVTYWDLEMTSNTDPDYQKTQVKGKIFCESEVTEYRSDPYASGWQG